MNDKEICRDPHPDPCKWSIASTSSDFIFASPRGLLSDEKCSCICFISLTPPSPHGGSVFNVPRGQFSMSPNKSVIQRHHSTYNGGMGGGAA